MAWSTRSISCISTLWTTLFLFYPTAGTAHVPRESASSETIARRACEPAAPDVNESLIIASNCNQTLAQDFDQCSERMTLSMQNSTANTCGQYFNLLSGCLTANKNDSTACSDSLLGYQDCKVYTMQAYAYCGCYYTLPGAIADCANEQLQPQPLAQTNATVPTTTTPLNTVPISSDIPTGPVTIGAEPTPPSEESLSTSSQSLLATSDPQVSTAPFDSGTTWSSPNAAPNASINLPTTTTAISTYTTTVYTATAVTITTTTSTVSTSTLTVSTCTDGAVTIPLQPPVSTPGRNGSAVCVGCRRGRRSKIL